MKKQVILLFLSLFCLNSGILAQNPDELALEKKIADEVASAIAQMSISRSNPQPAMSEVKHLISNDQELYEVINTVFESNQEKTITDKELTALIVRLNRLDSAPNVRLAALPGTTGLIYNLINDYYQKNIINNTDKVENFIKNLLLIYWINTVVKNDVKNYERIKPLITTVLLPEKSEK